MRRHLGLEVITLSFLATNLGNLPAFSMGALGPQLMAEFDLSELYMGALVSGFYVLSALGSYPSGYAVAHYGWQRTMMAMGGMIACAGLVFAVPVSAFGFVVAGMVIAGAANSLVQPAANEALLAFVPLHRRGLAFGIKQTAGPAGTVIAGLSLLMIVPHFGWRATLYGLVPLGILLVAWASRFRAEPSNSATDVRPLRPAGALDPQSMRRARTSLLVLCGSAGLGAAVANGAATFYVIDAVRTGVSSQTAGLLLALGSVGSVLTRLLSGFFADRRTGRHLRTVAIMMLVGGVGFAVIACARGHVGFAIGAVLSLGVGWGWNGLLQHGTMALYRDSAAHVTGLLQTFVFAGAVVGPLWVGSMAEAAGFPISWTALAVAMLVSALGISLFRHRVRIYGV
jgi:MFS family permease